ncbi:MAG TPA: hypothetical protein VEB22_11490 [Phycisphaerales bacterium]|nr:hypothetical protein [Phycisphaerales bacterium]
MRSVRVLLLRLVPAVMAERVGGALVVPWAAAGAALWVGRSALRVGRWSGLGRERTAPLARLLIGWTAAAGRLLSP